MLTACRLCLSQSDKLTELDEVRDGLPISVIAMIICPVKIEACDNFPKQICDECLNVLLNAYKLRDVSNDTERYLRSCNGEEAHEIEDDLIEKVENADIMEEIEESEMFVDDDGEDVQPSKENSFIIYEEEASCSEGTQQDSKYRVDCNNFATKKSAVWYYFGYLRDEKGVPVEEEQQYYFCKICVENEHTMRPKYKIESTATSVLFSHLNRVHGIKRSEMSENPLLPPNQPAQEFIPCEVCGKNLLSGSMSIHMGIEHVDGAPGRCKESPNEYRVNCFKNSSKSLAWDYFGALENVQSEQLDAYYFYCRLCVEEDGKLNPKYTKNTSTSILLQHLKNAHIPKPPEELAKRKLPAPIISTGNDKRQKIEGFNCGICGQNQESRKALNRHLSKEHSIEQPKNFSCQVENCGKSFSMRDTLIKHTKTIHQGTRFACNRCPTILSTRMSLRRHIESCHLKLKSYQCDSCEATYTEQKSLKNHMLKVHLGILEKKVPCGLCDLMFPNLWSLRRHQLTHTGEVRRFSTTHEFVLILLHFRNPTSAVTAQCLMPAKETSPST